MPSTSFPIMKRYTILFAIFCLAFTCFSKDLVIATKGVPSRYQIVYPNSSTFPSTSLYQYVRLAGTFLQKSIKNATGVTLSLVSEASKSSSKKSIYIGGTNALKAAGLSTEDFAKWEHAIAVRGDDIFIYGTDWGNPIGSDGWFVRMTHGSLKAACVFAEKFVSTRVVGYDKGKNGVDAYPEGIVTLPMNEVTVPSDFSYRYKPDILNSSADSYGLLYHVANNYYWASGASFDVHWPPQAIPTATYATSHPEYFALISGRRNTAHYCFSNPDVQELLYKEALARADKGYSVVEFGQQDGFIGCECEACKKLFNTDDWGEKLWRLNSMLAARLKKERPNVQVAIASYGPTHQTPKSFDQFPVDMILDIAPMDKKLCAAFEEFNLSGVACWAYMGGEFRPSGYSTGYSFNGLRKELDFYRSAHVSYIYDCGIDTAHALSAPWIYAWLRWRGDSNEDAETILHDYCRYAFGEKAEEAFVKFFQLIDDRLEEFPLDETQDYNDLEAQSNGKAITLWQNRYPADVVAELERLFNEAIALCDENNKLLPSLKTEFKYLKLSADVCNTLKNWQADTNYENGCALADALETRNNFINGLPVSGGLITGQGLEGVELKKLKAGGRMLGIFGGVFEMDPALFRQRSAYVQAIPVKDFKDDAWNDAPVCSLMPLKDNSGASPLNVNFQVGYTDTAFLFKITSPLVNSVTNTTSGDLWANNDVKEIFMAAGNSMTQFAFSPVKDSKFVYDIAGGTSRIKNWTHTDTVTNGVWYSEVTLPFYDALYFTGFTSEPIGKRVFLQMGFSTRNRDKVYCWNWNDSVSIKGNTYEGIDSYLACSQNLAAPQIASNPKIVAATIRQIFQLNCGKMQMGVPETETTMTEITAWNKTLPSDGDARWVFSGRSGSITSAAPARFYLEGTQTAIVHVSMEGTGEGYVRIYPEWHYAYTTSNVAVNDQVARYEVYIKDLPKKEFSFLLSGANGASNAGAYFKLKVELGSPVTTTNTLKIKSIVVETPNP